MTPRTLAIDSYRSQVSQGLWVATDLQSKDDLSSSIVRSSLFTWCYQHSFGWASTYCIKSCRLSAAKRHCHQSMYSNMHEKCFENLSWSDAMAMYIILSATQKQPSLAGSRSWNLLLWLDNLWNLPYFVKDKVIDCLSFLDITWWHEHKGEIWYVFPLWHQIFNI